MTDDKQASGWHTSAPFAARLGVETRRAADGQSELALPASAENTNRKGDIHGGVIGTLLDMAGGTALRGLEPGLKGVSTVTMTVNFLAPARGDLIARGTVVKSGRTLGWSACTVTDAAGETVATASCTYRLIRERNV